MQRTTVAPPQSEQTVASTTERCSPALEPPLPQWLWNCHQIPKSSQHDNIDKSHYDDKPVYFSAEKKTQFICTALSEKKVRLYDPTECNSTIVYNFPDAFISLISYNTIQLYINSVTNRNKTLVQGPSGGGAMMREAAQLWVTRELLLLWTQTFSRPSVFFGALLRPQNKVFLQSEVKHTDIWAHTHTLILINGIP